MSNVKGIVISILIPILFGVIGSLFGGSSITNGFIMMPDFAPPDFIFPVVWTILYILMGISSYLVFKTPNVDSSKALFIYFIQLVVNSLWPLFFFRLNWFLFSFFVALLLIFLVGLMIYNFYKINKTAALLQLPYFLWLVFASILNYSIFEYYSTL